MEQIPGFTVVDEQGKVIAANPSRRGRPAGTKLKPKPERKAFLLWMPKSTHRLLKRKAMKEGLSMTEVIVGLIRAWVKGKVELPPS